MRAGPAMGKGWLGQAPLMHVSITMIGRAGAVQTQLTCLLGPAAQSLCPHVRWPGKAVLHS